MARRKAKPPGNAKARLAQPAAKPRLIVGVGASAGGLAAFKAFFERMPPDSGMAFVLVQHLDPTHKSLLVELLRPHTQLPVHEAADGMRVADNSIYVIPPDATLRIADGVLRVVKPAPPREHRRPIDTFFESLAEDQGERAICAVLAGAGSDGTVGLRVVKEHGGLTLAQAATDETAMSGMPSSAAATGLVDHVLPADEMPALLLRYQRSLQRADGQKGEDGVRTDMADHLAAISKLLRAAVGHDFSEYKDKTLIRRIQRRMQVLQTDTVPDYIRRLRKEPRQLELLFHELLIGVTAFFRDPLAFAALRTKVLQGLLEDKGAHERVRVWVPACATGEEVYSLAILLREAMIELGVSPRVQIFATDIDGRAIEVARAARYSRPMTGLSAGRLERWFSKDGNEYCAAKEIREMCIFSVHSLIKDPPFSKLDLISCRNLLIYMNATLQDRVIRTAHYALRPDGYLFLGPSESVTRNPKLFAVIDKKHRIFQRRDTASQLPEPVLGAVQTVAMPDRGLARAVGSDGVDQAARRIIEKYAPASVVVDRHGDVVRFFGQTGRYLDPSPGTASLNLLNILRKDLRTAARAALQKVWAAGEPVLHENIVITDGAADRALTLIVEPVAEREKEGRLCVVAFQDLGPVQKEEARAAAGSKRDLRTLKGLQQELAATKARLQATIDEMETAQEEMKSTAEEFQSVNEELQSSNEELETSKEEMQSVNEELQTVNAELNSKNDALARLNSDLRNLLDSTQIATIFLDRDLRIRGFTPGMTELFHLREGDRGRPITDIVTRLAYDDLKRDVKAVLRKLTVVEREVEGAESGAVFIMRIRPYRTLDNVIDGVVITFIDITERKAHERERARLAAIVESSQDAIIGHSLEGTITSWNAAAEMIFGYPAAEAIGKPIAMLVPAGNPDAMPHMVDRMQRGEKPAHEDVQRTRKGGAPVEVSLTISPVRGEKGEIVAASTIARDIAERRRAEAHRTILLAELDHRVKNALATIQSIAMHTAEGTTTTAEFLRSFNSRLKALANTHSLLTKGLWKGASLRAVVLQETAAYAGRERCTVEGPDLQLSATAALAFAMTFHELATNAAKYGALSVPNGRLRVTWQVRDTNGQGCLHLRWNEVNGPVVQPPRRRGFGTRLIEEGLAFELEAKVRLAFEPEGLDCTIEVPLASATQKQEGHAETRAS